ncbi:MAG TPA: alpha/beta hydrolase, partial [Propionibacteriaceae bacterium]
ASIWICLGAAMVAVPVWLGWTRWAVLLNGHPASLLAVILCAMGGVVALAWGLASLLLGGRYDREIEPGEPGRRTNAELRRRAKWRIALAVPALLVCTLTVSVLAWSRPLPAGAVAVSAMRSGGNVRVVDRLTWYELQPVRKNQAGRTVKPTVGLVFHPGGRVDSRAYAHILRPLAAAGYLVVVLKEPFGIGLVQANHAETVLDVHPEITRWAVGGHSLGGVAAASFADSHASVKGLLLYAGYPAGRLTRTDLQVVSVSGSADGLATPADIAASKADLPASARFVVVPGAVHSFFGDYGDQSGDGTPTTPRGTAQAKIVQASQGLMTSLTPRPKPAAKKR